MRNRYSYIFGGHAIVAEIPKPAGECGILGATALPVTGGCAKAEVGSQEWEVPGLPGRNSFQSGSSFISGQFTARDTRPYAKTIAIADLNGLNLLGRVTVERLSAHLVAETLADEDEPAFSFETANPTTGKQDQDPIQGLRVDGIPIRVQFDRSALKLSFEKLREKFEPLIPRSIVKLSFPPDQRPKSDVSIEHGNIIRIGDAQLHFGELLIGPGFRNVNLFRLHVGGKGQDSAVDVASGPQGWPP